MMGNATARTRTVRVDQAVHGYDRGHRLIASSREIDGAAGQLMLSMSDLLTSTLMPEGASYVVGYPLKDENAYVVARTWPAPEMPRPGSVWTRSLVVGYEALTTLDDPTALIELLSPLMDWASWRAPVPLTLPPDARRGGLRPAIPMKSARAAIAALYNEEPKRRVTLQTTGSDDEELALALWRQMWPALRRDTAFITAVDPLPAAIDVGCLLTFTAGRAPRVTSDDDSDGRPGISALLADLPIVGPTQLRSFIARHAFDARRPRAAAAALAELWTTLATSGPDAAIDAAQASGIPDDSPRLARDLVERVLAASQQPEYLSKIVETFGTYRMKVDADLLGSSVEALSGPSLGAFLDRTAPSLPGTFGEQAFRAVGSAAPTIRLAEACAGLDARARLLTLRPELARQRPFWPKADDDRAALVEAAGRAEADVVDALIGIEGPIGPLATGALLTSFPTEAPEALFRRLADQDRGWPSLEVLATASKALVAGARSGIRLSPSKAEALTRAGFSAGAIGRPPQRFWLELPVDSDLDSGLALTTVRLVAGLTSRDVDGRRAVVANFARVLVAARSETLPGEIAAYLRSTIRDLGISRLSLDAALTEAAVSAFEDRGSISPELLKAAEAPWQLEALLDSIRRRRGPGTLRDLHRASAPMSGTVDWRAQQLRDAVTERKGSLWFWF